MVRTEVQTNTHVYYRVTSQRTRLQLLLDAFINGRDVFARNYAAFDVVDELVTFGLEPGSSGTCRSQRDRTDRDHQTAWRAYLQHR